jgi:acyl-coenzyme A synthetase/AMP-(fatty) acid ligase
MELFFKDSSNNIEVTWTQLLSDLNETDSFNPYCFSNNYYEVFKHIITSLILGEEIILLDSDFTSEELIKLTGFSEYSSFSKSIDISDKCAINSKNDLIEIVRSIKNNWSITLFTSGTTGLSKKVTHSFESITRFVKTSESNSTNIWGFAYNPTHMAGLQVFFQALLNGNSLIRLFGLSKEQIFNAIKIYDITNISATPTFYRLLLPFGDSFSSVLRITSGGEKFDEKTISKLRSIFPNAKITNVYASTEAGTLFASDSNIFTIKQGLEHLMKIKNGELLIHQSLLGNSEGNTEEWYYTGDLVEIISEIPIKFLFLSRKTEMINVGGYKVNPNEVEETIRNIPGITDVRVFAKSNSVLGSIICCEAVKSDNQLDETIIRTYLQTKLQEYKIPRMIRFVNELSTTRTGKLKRNEQ